MTQPQITITVPYNHPWFDEIIKTIQMIRRLTPAGHWPPVDVVVAIQGIGQTFGFNQIRTSPTQVEILATPQFDPFIYPAKDKP